MTIEVKIWVNPEDAEDWLREIAKLMSGLKKGSGEYLYVSLSKEDPTKRDC